MIDRADVAIIGGGAAGLATAIFAGQASGGKAKVVILDGARILGAKILVSGGGRCNVTHDQVSPDDFNGTRSVVKNILAAFGVTKAVEWFGSMGVELKLEPTGKLFPVSDSAKTVLNAMLRKCADLNISIETGSKVTRMAPPAAGEFDFLIESAGGVLRASKVVLATGGRSLPRSGSDGNGWQLARALGHSVTSTHAALVPLVLDHSMFHTSVAGISHEVQLTTFVENKRVDRRTGSLLWTHFGVSGPVVMDASRFWVMGHDESKTVRVEANLLPDFSFESLDRWFVEQGGQRPKATIVTTLSNRLSERLARAVIGYAGIDPTTVHAQLARDLRRKLVLAVTAMNLAIVDHRGWNYAEVTAGGVPLDEIDYRTMESKKNSPAVSGRGDFRL